MAIEASFEDFVHGHITAMIRQASMLTGERQAAEELVQETLIRVSRGLHRIRDDGNPVGYATKTMFRTSVSSWRIRRRRPIHVELTVDPSTTHDDYATVDTRLMLRAAL